MHVLLCPHCGGSAVHRSRRKGVFEHTVLRVLNRRPYRCFSCGSRFYDHVKAVRIKKSDE